jgi:hypothetical protein
MAELDAWGEAGLTATLWWRDDDATEPNAPLRRLRDATEVGRVPITLSVIPAAASEGLAGFIDQWPGATPVQHGFSHTNHAPTGSGPAEFASNRPLAGMIADIATGDWIMKGLFGAHTLPVLVPPWNRIPAVVTAILGDYGFIGLSSHSAWDVAVGPSYRLRVRAAAFRALTSLSTGLDRCRRTVGDSGPAGGKRRTIITVGATIDVIDWRLNRFLGERLILEQVIRHLRMRRLGRGDAASPTGLLTHHGVMDEPSWRFVEDFAVATRSHPAVRWLAAPQVFSPWPQWASGVRPLFPEGKCCVSLKSTGVTRRWPEPACESLRRSSSGGGPG